MRPAACPSCKREAQRGTKLFPFCSERCQLIDLGRWLGEEYRVPEEIDAGMTVMPVPDDGESGERR